MRSTRLSTVCRSVVLTAGVLSLQACGDDSSSTTGGGGGGGTTTSAATTGTTTGATSGQTTGATSSSSSGGGDGGSSSVTTSVGTGGQGGGDGGGTTTGTGGDGGGTTTGTGGDGGGSGGSNGTGGEGGVLDCSNIESTDIPGDYCDAFAAGFCSQLGNCINWFFVSFLGTEAECLLWAKQQCQYETLLPGQDETAEELETCAELVVNAPCGCYACGQDPNTGTLVDGTACEVDGQCQSGNCNRDGDACGQCEPTVPVNGSCAANDAKCADGLYCDEADDLCKTAKPPGSPCVENYECGENRNNTFPKCADGECSLGLAEGEDCTGDNDDACAFPLFCGFQSETCDPIVINGVNGACGYDLVDMTLSFCQGDLYCTATFTDELEGTCLARNDLDDACTLVEDGDPLDSNDHDCLPHLSCIGGACAVTPDVTCE